MMIKRTLNRANKIENRNNNDLRIGIRINL